MIPGIICWALAAYQEKCLRRISSGFLLNKLTQHNDLASPWVFQVRRLKLGEIKKFPKSDSWYVTSINFREQACGVALRTHQWDVASRSFILNRAHQSESIFSVWRWNLKPRLGAGKIVQLLEHLLPKPLRKLGLDPQSLHKYPVSMVAHLEFQSQRVETRVPQSKLASKTSSRFGWETPPQRTW